MSSCALWAVTKYIFQPYPTFYTLSFPVAVKSRWPNGTTRTLPHFYVVLYIVEHVLVLIIAEILITWRQAIINQSQSWITQKSFSYSILRKIKHFLTQISCLFILTYILVYNSDIPEMFLLNRGHIVNALTVKYLKQK